MTSISVQHMFVEGMYMKEERPAYYPGMFDLLKGIMMIGIILTHISEIIPVGVRNGSDTAFLTKCLFFLPDLLSFGNASMQIFFLVSGFGFAAIPLRKCIRRQSKQLLRPFLLTGAAVVLVHFISHYAAFRYLPGAAYQTGIVAISHLLGLRIGFQFNGVQLCSIGSVWFLMALFEGWILMTVVMNTLPKRIHGFLAVCFLFVSAAIFDFLPAQVYSPLCFYSLFMCAGNLYLGMQIKKRNWLEIPLPPVVIFLMVLIAVVSQFTTNIQTASAVSAWVKLIINVVGAESTAFLVMRIAVRINRWSNWLVAKVRLVGRYSIWILCAHTIESQGLLWYLFMEKMQGHEIAAFLLMCVFRFGLIFGMCYLFYLFDKKVRRLKRKRRAALRV